MIRDLKCLHDLLHEIVEEFSYTVIPGLRPDIISKKGKTLSANETTDLDNKAYYPNRDLSTLE